MHFSRDTKLAKKKPETLEEKVEFLEQFITEERKEKINKVLSHRIKQFSIILENIYDPHNISAVLRSADGLGFHKIFVAEKEKYLKLSSTVSTGAEKWLDVTIYPDINRAAEMIRQSGYKIAAGIIDEKTVDFFSVNWLNDKWAFLLGNEHEGLTQEAISIADIHFKIPIYGFIQSYNISVTAAMIMFHLRFLLNQKNIKSDLTEEEKLTYKYLWLKRDLGIEI